MKKEIKQETTELLLSDDRKINTKRVLNQLRKGKGEMDLISPGFILDDDGNKLSSGQKVLHETSEKQIL